MQGFVDISLLCTFKRMRNLLGIQEDWKQDKVPEQIVLGVRDHLIPNLFMASLPPSCM